MKKYFSFANIVITLGILTTFVYMFSYLFPITDDAFVINNIRPVAAQVNGFITNLYVKNGQYVKKGEKLFTVFDKPYYYSVMQLTANLQESTAKLASLKKTLEKDRNIFNNHKAMYIKSMEDDEKYQQAYNIRAISLMELQHSKQETIAAMSLMKASKEQLSIDEENIKAQQQEIISMNAKLNIEKIKLGATIVYAASNGVIQNMFISISSPVNINQPLFSFVDTDDVYFQANFNETDLTRVHNGSKVLIFPRMYLGIKIFHGIVTSDYWGVNRQNTDTKTQMQNVVNENEWILLPQRLPVQIKVLDPDYKYPLRAGSSAYVYIQS